MISVLKINVVIEDEDLAMKHRQICFVEDQDLRPLIAIQVAIKSLMVQYILTKMAILVQVISYGMTMIIMFCIHKNYL
jgi:hypothetical protein